jgi:phenylpyruvate tautomerase PptA (4-oxalocrotonate tautomerase family)
MPICNIKAPPGISHEAKVRVLEKINETIDEGYDHIGVTIITLEEDALENVMIAGRMASVMTALMRTVETVDWENP